MDHTRDETQQVKGLPLSIVSHVMQRVTPQLTIFNSKIDSALERVKVMWSTMVGHSTQIDDLYSRVELLERELAIFKQERRAKQGSVH